MDSVQESERDAGPGFAFSRMGLLFLRLHVLVPSVGNVRSMQLNDEVARFFRWLHSSHIVTETYYSGYDFHGR